jgi:lipopolysaccharide transport system permease protein
LNPAPALGGKPGKSKRLSGMTLTEVWNFRWLFVNFLRREINNRYIGTISGLFWVFLNPLALLGIYWFVFAVVFKVSIPEMQGRDFIEFVALGLWPWLAFQEGLQRASMSIQSAEGLIKKVSFPHELLVYASVISTYLIHLAGFTFVLIVMLLSGKEIHLLAVPAVVIILLFQAMFTMGLAMLFSAMHVFMRDIEHFLTPMMMVWFYATPVLYTAKMVPQQVRDVIEMNPMASFIGAIRDALLNGAVHLDASLAVLAAGSIALFFFGARLPRSAEHRARQRAGVALRRNGGAAER